MNTYDKLNKSDEQRGFPHNYLLSPNETQFCEQCGYAVDHETHKKDGRTLKVGGTMDGQIQATGVKKDEGKPRWELLPFDAIEGVVEILTFGAKKYDARNWEKGIVYGRVFGATMRHLTAWWRGEDKDKESGRSHLEHAMCELMFLSAFEKRGMAHLDDRPKKDLPF